MVGFNTVELLGIRNLRYSGFGIKKCDFEPDTMDLTAEMF